LIAGSERVGLARQFRPRGLNEPAHVAQQAVRGKRAIVVLVARIAADLNCLVFGIEAVGQGVLAIILERAVDRSNLVTSP
jgi:hypothetical protein